MFPAELFQDDGFRELEEGPQRLFMWLWVHPDLNTAGIIAVQPHEWASAAAGLTPDVIDCYIKVLQSEDWIDYEDGQLWLRPFMKLDRALKSPSTYVNAARAVKTVRSRRLRAEIWAQFRTFPLPTAHVPDTDDGKARRALTMNEAVEKARTELEQRMTRTGVRESLPAPEGDHPHPHPQPHHQHDPSYPPSDAPSDTPSREGPKRPCTYGCDAPAVPGKACCAACVRTGRS